MHKYSCFESTGFFFFFSAMVSMYAEDKKNYEIPLVLISVKIMMSQETQIRS